MGFPRLPGGGLSAFGCGAVGGSVGDAGAGDESVAVGVGDVESGVDAFPELVDVADDADELLGGVGVSVGVAPELHEEFDGAVERAFVEGSEALVEEDVAESCLLADGAHFGESEGEGETDLEGLAAGEVA